MSAVFTVAYSGLTAEEARLYRLLGLFPGRSVDIGTAVCVAGVDPQTADDLLFALEEAALLEWGEEDGRYRFHDLVRSHARERAMDEESEHERDAVLERCVDYYVTGAAFADLAVMGDRLRIGGEATRRPHAYDPFEGPDRRRAALAWLAAERHEALAVLRAAAEDGGMEHQVWQLAESLTALYLNHRHLDDWRVCCELGAGAAAADGRPDAEALLRALLSRPLLDLGEDARAREELDLALARAEKTGNLPLRASVREFDGRYWDRHDAQRAIESYERSIELNEQFAQRASGEHEGEGHGGSGEPDEVAAESAESAESGDRTGGVRGIATARFFLACALDVTGQHDRALAELLGVHERFQELDDTRMAGRALAALGRVRQSLGEHEAAREAYGEAVRMLRETQSTHYEAQALEAWATLDERQSEPEAAHERLLRALEIYEAGGSPRAEQLRERLGAAEV
ncbi:tetratricopeptide repeat protein [Streptomyces iconiensis]|uniref:Tetratricopeptide repeat protein n=1 Tax=Streptomyces iconiensis TaxID=1384038 RepID=A0ABT6ZVR9_9ACTN|nr:tetratricopeptide repeat protein [Streptomyces iconiensis]MDJ1133170.1 tetratricopeptide repeat protein [Streptomyces iconiensis]